MVSPKLVRDLSVGGIRISKIVKCISDVLRDIIIDAKLVSIERDKIRELRADGFIGIGVSHSKLGGIHGSRVVVPLLVAHVAISPVRAVKILVSEAEAVSVSCDFGYAAVCAT